MKTINIPWIVLVALVLSLPVQPAHAGSSGLVVHEWGTFTSFQGGDGKLEPWKPLVTSRLPDFVYNWSRPGLNRRMGNPIFFGKESLYALQRLETPVVYFYSDDEQTVDLSVKFPLGKITEWFPQADQVGPTLNDGQPWESRIGWSSLRLFPAAQGRKWANKLKPATAENHYFTARETDSDYVQAPAGTNEFEKFLFYRGTGDFSTPLRVTMTTNNAVVLSNTGRETISHLFVYRIADSPWNGSRTSAGGFVFVRDLKPGEQRMVYFLGADIPAKDAARAIGGEMASALAQCGLYPREAKAMVNTWNDSWFQENGLRVLYILPRAWTDQTLPMTLKPAPRELVRVMVGRAEVFTPGAEEDLVLQLRQAAKGDAAASLRAKKTLKDLGRFAGPAFNRALAEAKFGPNEAQKLALSLNPELPGQ